LEGLKVHLKDLQAEVQGLDDVRRNFVIRRAPGSEGGNWTFRGEEGSPLVYSLGGNSAGFGLKLAEMNPGLAEYFSADEGLLVLDVQEDSSLGLAPGDVILSIDGRAIENQRDVMRILGSYEEDEAVSFTVIRKGRETRVEGRIG
jgi:S1-C subfamily serine protease